MTDLQVAQDRPRYLTAPSGSCLGELSNARWSARSVVEVGDHHIGVLSNSSEVHAAFEAALAAHVVDDPEAPSNFGIFATPTTALDTSRSRYLVFDGCQQVASTTRLDRAVVIVAAHLERHLPAKDLPIDALELRVAAIAGVDGVVLAPWQLPYKVESLEARLRRTGLRLIEGVSAIVDTRSAEMVAQAPRLLGERWAREVATRANSGAIPAVTLVGRSSVHGWLFVDRRIEPGALPRAQAVGRGIELVAGERPVPNNLERLARLVREVDTFVVEDYSDLIGVAARRLVGRRVGR